MDASWLIFWFVDILLYILSYSCPYKTQSYNTIIVLSQLDILNIIFDFGNLQWYHGSTKSFRKRFIGFSTHVNKHANISTFVSEPESSKLVPACLCHNITAILLREMGERGKNGNSH